MPTFVLAYIFYSSMIKALLASAMLASNVGMGWFDAQFDTYDKMQKELHELAEPGFVEYKSSELIIKHLEENGFKIERGVANLPTAFVATFGEGEPVLAVEAALGRPWADARICDLRQRQTAAHV